jgi:hypothetical protein
MAALSLSTSLARVKNAETPAVAVVNAVNSAAAVADAAVIDSAKLSKARKFRASFFSNPILFSP